jgi:uncharacterized membrane protein
MTEKEKNIGMAVIAYILFFIPLLTNAKDDPFVKYHVKQGLALFLLGVASMVLSFFPFLGGFLSIILDIAILVLFVMGVMNALYRILANGLKN